MTRKADGRNPGQICYHKLASLSLSISELLPPDLPTAGALLLARPVSRAVHAHALR